MPATPIKYTPEAGSVAAAKAGPGGAYAEIEVPGDYEVVLIGVENYDFTKEGKTRGWVATYSCETPSGGVVTFDDYLAFTEKAQFKIDQFFEAHASGLLQDGVEITADPNAYVGTTVGAHIDFPRNKQGEPTSTYRGIERIFPIVDKDEFSGDDTEGESVSTPSEPEAVELI